MRKTIPNKYGILKTYVLKRPKNYEVIETAEKANSTTIGLKLGEDQVLVIDGPQLRAIEKKYKEGKDYEFYIPPQNSNGNKIRLRK